ALSFAASRAAAQVGTTTDIITGTVVGPDSQRLAGALVQALSVETQISRHATTDARGRFTIVFPDGGGQYDLTIRFIGMAPATVSVARQGDEDRLVANVQMGASAVPLEAVTVSARRGSRLVERVGPGAVGRSLSADQLSRLPVDALDLRTVAALAPGVLSLAATDSTEADFSVAGQRPTANAITLDGLSLGSSSVPQDAIRSTRVVTSSYDAARGQFSGGRVASTTGRGERCAGADPWALGRPHARKRHRVPAVRLEGVGGPNAHPAARRAVGLAATHAREPPRPPADRGDTHGAGRRGNGVAHVPLRGESDQRSARLSLGGSTGRDRPRHRAGRASPGRLRSPGRSSRRGDARLRRQFRPAATGRQREPGAERRALLVAGWRWAPSQARRSVERHRPGPEPDAEP